MSKVRTGKYQPSMSAGSKYAPGLEGVELLKSGGQHYDHMLKVKEQLSAYFVQTIAQYGRFLEEDGYTAVPRETVQSVLDEDEDISVYGEEELADLRKLLNAQRFKKILEVKEFYVSAYACILRVLPEEMLIWVKKHSEWDTVNGDASDPLALWSIIEEVQLNGSAGLADADRQYAAAERRNKAKQGNLSLFRYRQVFESMHRAAEATGLAAIPDGQKAIEFIMRSSGADEFVGRLRSDVALGIVQWPADVSAAYKMLSDQESIRARDTGVSGRVGPFTGERLSGFAAVLDKPRFEGNCNWCGKKGHKESECFAKQRGKPKAQVQSDSKNYKPAAKRSNDKSAFVVSRKDIAYTDAPKETRFDCAFTLLDADQMSGRGDVAEMHRDTAIWDSGCIVMMLNSLDALRDVRNVESLQVRGVGGPVSISKVGVAPVLGEAYYNPDLPVNLINPDYMQRHYKVTWKQGKYYRVFLPDGMTITFHRRPDGLYVNHTLIKHLRESSGSRWNDGSTPALITVEENKKRFTAAEVRRADMVSELIRNLGHCSYEEVIRTLHAGSIIDCPLTSQDVVRHKAIYGGNTLHKRGTMVTSAPKALHRGELILPVPRKVSVHTDIVFYETVPILTSVVKPINLVMTTDLVHGSKSSSEVRAALEDQISLLRVRAFEIECVYSDSEAVFKSRNAQLSDVPISPAPARSHEPVIERAVRVIKERGRSVLASLPFPVAKKFVKFLVGYVVNRINCMVRTSGIGVSAREAFRGVKMNFKLDVCLCFGDYCVVSVDSKTMSKARGVDAIALMPCDDGRGGWRFLNLVTLLPITSANYTRFPTPDHVVERMKRVAEGDEECGDAPDTVAVPGSVVSDVADGGVQEQVETSVGCDVSSGVHFDSEAADSSEARDDSGAGIVPEPETVVNAPTNEPNLTGIPQAIIAGGTADVPAGVSDGLPDGLFAYMQLSVKGGIEKHGQVADEAIGHELEQMVSKKVWKPVGWSQVSASEVKGAIRCFMFLKEKFGPDGKMTKLKGRLVAGGHMQDPATINHKSSPTVHPDNLSLLYAIAAAERRMLQSVDIEGAFLECDMKGAPVYMIIDGVMANALCEIEPSYREYRDGNGRVLVVLLKALYGCVQSARLFYDKLRLVLEDIGFVVNPDDDCVFNTIVDGKQCTVSFHVDDLLLSHVSDGSIEKVVVAINGRFRGIKRQLGPTFQHLGVNVKRKENGDICLDMARYTKTCVEEFGVCKGAKSPSADDLFALCDSVLLSPTRRKEFHTHVAKLLYLSKRTRPDILTPVSFLAGRVNEPTEQDWAKLARVFGYLSSTVYYGVRYKGGSDILLVGYGDASFMVHDDCKSRSGGVCFMSGGVVSTLSSKQKLVTKSSTEAELVAACDVGTVLLILRSFVEKQGYGLPASVLYQDNTGVLALLKAGKPTSHQTKHIKLRYFFLVEHIRGGEIVAEWCSSPDMLADGLTKGLAGKPFFDFRNGVVCPVAD